MKHAKLRLSILTWHLALLRFQLEASRRRDLACCSQCHWRARESAVQDRPPIFMHVTPQTPTQFILESCFARRSPSRCRGKQTLDRGLSPECRLTHSGPDIVPCRIALKAPSKMNRSKVFLVGPKCPGYGLGKQFRPASSSVFRSRGRQSFAMCPSRWKSSW